MTRGPTSDGGRMLVQGASCGFTLPVKNPMRAVQLSVLSALGDGRGIASVICEVLVLRRPPRGTFCHLASATLQSPAEKPHSGTSYPQKGVPSVTVAHRPLSPSQAACEERPHVELSASLMLPVKLSNVPSIK